MMNVFLIAILILLIGSISFYLYKQKKKGNHCIGCPYANQCGNKPSGECQKNCVKE